MARGTRIAVITGMSTTMLATLIYWQNVSTPGTGLYAGGNFAGAAFFDPGMTWDWVAMGADIDAQQDAGVISAWPLLNDAGTLLAGHTDAGMVLGYQSSSGLAPAGLGTAQTNHGQSFQGGWWQRNASVTLPGFSGPGFRQLTRIVFSHEAGASGTTGIFLSAARSGIGSITIYAQSLTQFRAILQTTEGVYTAQVTAPRGISVGPHILDVYTSDSEYSGSLQRANTAFWLDGVYVGAAEHTADQTAFTSNQINQLAVGAGVSATAPLIGRTVYGVAMATNATSDWWAGYQSTYYACVKLGLCPDMGTGRSAGTGRGLPAGYDAGTQNIVQPSGFIADGRTRTGWAIRLPPTYDPNVPVNLYVHFCGCSWTGASCRGSYVGGSAATADPQLETPDPTGINVYADAQYTDPTDCTAAGGGNGWPKSNTPAGDYQLRYTEAMLAYVRQNFAVRATFCAGRSNGGSWCEWLGAIRPDLFSGGQSAIGYLPGTANGGSGMTATIATGRTPMYLSHNRDDPTVAVNYARLSIPFWLAQNLGIDAGPGNPRTGDGGFGWCISTDGGVANDGSLLGGCGCGATQEVYDSGPPGSICCTWPASLANTAALDGGAGRAVRYCEGTGGHVPPPGEGQNSYNFWMTHGEDAGG